MINGEISASDRLQRYKVIELEALVRFVALRGRVGLFRFRHDQVAASAYSDQPDASVEEDGALTAVVLAALKLADDEAFGRIESAMRRIVPSVERLRIKPAKVKHPSHPSPVTGSKLYLDFRGAKDVPAHHASQGTLVVLALLTVLYSPHRPDVILLDDFDHSLHPRAQMELVRMIKDLLALEDFKETQIIATTHSPYVLDELPPENVIGDPRRKRVPDLAIEVVWTRGGIDKLEIYRGLGVGEVWFWREGRIDAYVLRDGRYQASSASEVVPGLDLQLVARVATASPAEALAELRKSWA